MNRRIVIGDIHGCYATLRALLEEKIQPASDDQIFFVGDLIDRGPDSRNVIEYIIRKKQEGYQFFAVRGNHEVMLLNSLINQSFMMTWIANGAEETFRSFDIPEIQISDHESLKLIPENFISYLESLPYYLDLGDYLIVHAGLNFDSGNILKDLNAMLWIRKMDYNGKKISNKTIIHGHTPVPLITIKQQIGRPENKILNIDTGCVYKDLPGYGILTGLNLDSRELYTQENID